MRRAAIFAALSLLSLCACSGSAIAPSQPIFKFPSRQEVAAIPETPLTIGSGVKVVRVDRWEVQLPDAAAAKDPRLAQWLAGIGPRLRPSPALACAARELARFHVKHGGAPTEGLERFVIARCGSPRGISGAAVVEVSGSAGATDDQVVETALPKLRPKLAAVEGEAGVGFARDGDRASVVALAASLESDVAQPPPPAEGVTTVPVSGTLGGQPEMVVALVNLGAHGVSHCARDLSVALPKFSFQCPMDAGDTFTWIDLASKNKDALLARLVGQLLVVREGASPAYVAASVGAPAPVATREQFAAVVGSRLNEVRAAAHLAPLELVPAQSRVNGRLAAALVSAMAMNDERATNRLTLGLVAGWEVGRTIRDGDILASLSPATNDAAAWLGDALERPMGRSVLLDAKWRYVAVGPAIAEGGGLAAAVTTYATFEGVDHGEDVKSVFATIAGHRAARGLPPPVRIGSLPALDEAMRRIATGEQPGAVVDDLLQSSVHQLQAGVRLFAFEVLDPGRIVTPAEMLGPAPPHMAIGVTHHTVAGAPWGQTVILVVMIDDGASRMVRRPGEAARVAKR